MNEFELIETAEYKAYHKKVVDACVALTSEEMRSVWDGAYYTLEFAEGCEPEDVASDQLFYFMQDGE